MIKMSEKNTRIVQAIYDRGGYPYFVGGCVRDYLMGIEPKDFDIEVYGLSLEDLIECLNPFGADLVGKSFGVIKVGDLDISIPREDRSTGDGTHTGFVVKTDPTLTFEQACSRRDFTINAILMDCKSGDIIDPFNGQKDIKNGFIRHINDEFFKEDPLRILRAVQFAARFSFEIDLKTSEFMISMAEDGMLENLAPERVFDELKKIILKGRPCDLRHIVYACGADEAVGLLHENYDIILNLRERNPKNLIASAMALVHGIGEWQVDFFYKRA